MASDVDLRTALAKRVTTLLQHSEATAVFPGTLPDGTRQVLVAQPNDELGPIFRRVRTFGGPTNVRDLRGNTPCCRCYRPVGGRRTGIRLGLHR